MYVCMYAYVCMYVCMYVCAMEANVGGSAREGVQVVQRERGEREGSAVEPAVELAQIIAQPRDAHHATHQRPCSRSTCADHGVHFSKSFVVSAPSRAITSEIVHSRTSSLPVER